MLREQNYRMSTVKILPVFSYPVLNTAQIWPNCKIDSIPNTL